MISTVHSIPHALPATIVASASVSQALLGTQMTVAGAAQYPVMNADLMHSAKRPTGVKSKEMSEGVWLYVTVHAVGLELSVLPIIMQHSASVLQGSLLVILTTPSKDVPLSAASRMKTALQTKLATDLITPALMCVTMPVATMQYVLLRITATIASVLQGSDLTLQQRLNVKL